MIDLKDKLVNKTAKISVIGLGYVGMPLEVSFSNFVDVIGFDINRDKITTYKNGIDPTKEVGDERISLSSVFFTSDEEDLRESDFHIVAVPTPINSDKTPDLTPVEEATKLVGRN